MYSVSNTDLDNMLHLIINKDFDYRMSNDTEVYKQYKSLSKVNYSPSKQF